MSGAPGSPRAPAGPSWLGLRPATLLALVGIAVLLVPLSALSQPADSSSPGGLLARLRAKAGLSQANLGEVDPASETMRFATLGLKNIAVTLLWDRANHYKKVEDWSSLSATLEQMTKLQPNFYSVWDFQAHNLSYNISVEFDDYRDRYAWVIKGIEFLRQGIAYNTREPRLLGRMGWFIGQKIGKSDETKQFRRLFKADDDFHDRDNPDRTLPERDNWLVAREKYRAGQALADRGAPLNTTALIFHSEPMMMAINYARALADDGEFGATAKEAWKLANEELGRFAERDVPTSWGVPIQLRLGEAEKKRAEQIAAELEKLLPGQFAALRKAKEDSLTAEQKAAMAIPLIDRSDAQMNTAAVAESQLKVSWRELVRKAPADVRSRAEELLRDHTQAEERATMIERYRDIVNFDFWKATCESEITDPALRARERTWRADKEFQAARLQAAKQAYEESFAAWREVLDASSLLRQDPFTAQDLAEVVGRYRKLLEQLDEPFPQPFVLQDMLDLAGPRQ